MKILISTLALFTVMCIVIVSVVIIFAFLSPQGTKEFAFYSPKIVDAVSIFVFAVLGVIIIGLLCTFTAVIIKAMHPSNSKNISYKAK